MEILNCYNSDISCSLNKLEGGQKVIPVSIFRVKLLQRKVTCSNYYCALKRRKEVKMKKLNKFLSFDWEAFAKGKTFMVTECKPWLDYDSKKVLGTKVGFIIIEDKTDYDVLEGEIAVSNTWEKGVIKIRKEINIPEKSIIQPKGVIASVYGEYRNQLSIEAKEINIVGK